MNGAERAHLLPQACVAVKGACCPFEAALCAAGAAGTGCCDVLRRCGEQWRDLGVGKWGQDTGLSEPGGEVGLEGDLVGVASAEILASLFVHDIVSEEDAC